MSSATQGAQAQHQAALNAGRFQIQHCTACARHVYFPRELCPHCGGMALQFVDPAGGGAVYATTSVRRKTEAGGDYNVCMVRLDEGVQLMGRVEGLATADVRVGLRVKAVVQQIDGRGVVVFNAEVAA